MRRRVSNRTYRVPQSVRPPHTHTHRARRAVLTIRLYMYGVVTRVNLARPCIGPWHPSAAATKLPGACAAAATVQLGGMGDGDAESSTGKGRGKGKGGKGGKGFGRGGRGKGAPALAIEGVGQPGGNAAPLNARCVCAPCGLILWLPTLSRDRHSHRVMCVPFAPSCRPVPVVKMENTRPDTESLAGLDKSKPFW